MARSVLLGAHSVTCMVVGSTAWLGSVVFIFRLVYSHNVLIYSFSPLGQS